MSKVLIFGGTGSIGKSCVDFFESKGSEVLVAPRSPDAEHFRKMKFDSVIWAQGKNLTSNLLEVSSQEEHEIFSANYFYVSNTLKGLLSQGALGDGSRLVVVSSIWEQIARSNKSTYIASKAALGGLVRGMAVELAPKRISINAVLPGVIDSDMTRKNLSESQIKNIEATTPGKNLVTLEEVASTIYFLATPASNGINGQSVIIDYGWSLTHEI